ncbi:hypothetical protein PHSY_004784 [Pseudozyma hubeiensis SY62]|uniref:Uncharacterized protein n=1 Tax=Pseudozyma hubeiensis (strain SY62) TaxID=1305764 RepID=R9P782_PSEHS|nr:hypothetical protein PHSY_004784 [Pseudozyma hubeiensis SY62]GAC97199.1 hypothetical protein PHSY_004784 [Pseudozyma hubeiensis SY62]
MIDSSHTRQEMRSNTTGEAALVPLPDSPNESLVHHESAVTAFAAPASMSTEQLIRHEAVEGQIPALSSVLQSPQRKVSAETKPMSPEKAALAAMFDSIKMPPPVSPSKSPRKASGSSILSSPSKQLSHDIGPTPMTLFRKTSSPPTSPSKVGSSDSAASRPRTRDSPLRRPVIISSSSSPGKALRMAVGESKNASTPLSPPSAQSRPARMRPSILASSSSPSAKLSDLTLNFDTTGTQELLFNQDASFLAAAGNAAADVTIDDSFDVSRARARIRSASAATASTRRSSPAKIGGGYKAKPRCSMVPEDGVPEIKSISPGKRNNTLGSRGLGVGRVVKNAAGDDTIELNLTGSFIANSSMIGGNLMDESGEASLLFGNNSFSISQSKSPKKETRIQSEKKTAVRGGSDDDDDDDEEEDFERDAKNVWTIDRHSSHCGFDHGREASLADCFSSFTCNPHGWVEIAATSRIGSFVDYQSRTCPVSFRECLERLVQHFDCTDLFVAARQCRLAQRGQDTDAKSAQEHLHQLASACIWSSSTRFARSCWRCRPTATHSAASLPRSCYTGTHADHVDSGYWHVARSQDTHRRDDTDDSKAQIVIDRPHRCCECYDADCRSQHALSFYSYSNAYTCRSDSNVALGITRYANSTNRLESLLASTCRGNARSRRDEEERISTARTRSRSHRNARHCSTGEDTGSTCEHDAHRQRRLLRKHSTLGTRHSTSDGWSGRSSVGRQTHQRQRCGEWKFGCREGWCTGCTQAIGHWG